MSRRTLVSIIIATYNEEKYIAMCLKSLMNQDYTPLEIIVVDDGSQDNTTNIVREFPQITLIETPHNGTAIARNTAVKKTSGEILVFLDMDMEFEPSFITNLIKPIINGNAKGTFSKLEYVKNWDKPLARCWNWNSNPHLPDGVRVEQDRTTGDDFRAILKSEFEKVRGYDNIGYTDTWTLAQKLGYKPVIAQGTKYYHYNPQSFNEVFMSAQWVGKRKYKFAILGTVLSIIRSFIGFSLLKGIFKALWRKEPYFIPFQVVYDLGVLKGTIESLLTGNTKK